MTNYEKAMTKDELTRSELNNNEHSYSANKKLVAVLNSFINNSSNSADIALAEQLIKDINGEGLFSNLVAIRRNTEATTINDYMVADL